MAPLSHSVQTEFLVQVIHVAAEIEMMGGDTAVGLVRHFSFEVECTHPIESSCRL
jgi:hypothetical protein